MEGRVGLDHVFDQTTGTGVARGDRPPQSADHPGRDGAGEAQRVANRDDQLSHLEMGSISELGGLGLAIGQLENGKV